MNIRGVLSVRLSVRSVAYIVTVALLAAVGFAEQTPWPILVAALLAVPASMVAVPCYYLAYGLLALVPGANPSSSSGSGTVAPDGGVLTSVSSGTPATWFTIAAIVLGILVFALAALVNVLLLQSLAAARRRRRNLPATTPSAT